MKIFTLLFLLILTLNSNAQQLTPHFMPTGFSNAQIRPVNDIVINHNNHYWIAFQLIGLGEYDGTTWTMHNVSSGFPSDLITSKKQTVQAESLQQLHPAFPYIIPESGLADSASFLQYDRLWKINRTTIDEFIYNNTSTTAAIFTIV